MDEPTGLQNLLAIATKPDNIPIIGLLLLVVFFTWLGLKQGFQNDKLTEEGKKDEIINKMWE